MNQNATVQTITPGEDDIRFSGAGEIIRRHREEQSMTLETLAGKVGVNGGQQIDHSSL
jgi:hypothetical protein